MDWRRLTEGARRATRLVIVFMAVALPTPGRAQSCENNLSAFPGWLEAVRQEALASGISARSVAVLNGVTFSQSVFDQDRAQATFAQTFIEFSNRLVSADRLQTGAQMLQRHRAMLGAIEQQYGVPAPVVVAFWALETDFGANNGGYPVVQALATLAFDCRRPAKFRPELFAVLRILDRGDLQPSDLVGGWAGELGQTQFLPTDYYRAGVDYDGDGRVDLLRSIPDVLASTANLMALNGWRRGEPWFEEAAPTADLPWAEADVSVQHPLSQWRAWGVVRRDRSTLPQTAAPASLLLPMGRFGPKFLAHANFQVYLTWNQSLTYMTTAAYFASRLAGAPAFDPGQQINALNIDQARQLQTILAGLGHDVGQIDGIIGLLTRTAVRETQIRLGMPPDGYPTVEFLAVMTGQTPLLTGAEASELQRLLLARGYDIGTVDGVIGSRTRAAVADLQRRLGLIPDGIATSSFLARIRNG